jgi:hypothetical protein
VITSSTNLQECQCEARKNGVVWENGMTYDCGVWIVWEDLG